jgi:nitrile hydratase
VLEHHLGPMNGAKVVARAWLDPDHKARLLADGMAAVAEFGFPSGPVADQIAAPGSACGGGRMMLAPLG